MSDRDDYDYPECVRRQVIENEYDGYRSAADFLNKGYYDVLSVQHEYGIFGGDSGAYLLNLLREVNMPIVTTLHTVLQRPSPEQRAVTRELLQLSSRIVVMSDLAVKILTSEYGHQWNSIDHIPHGIPDFSKTDSLTAKARLGIEGLMVLTFGLLSPDKGIQYAIEAMPKVLERWPNTTYVVLGATHPNVRSHAGEAYRESLMALAEKLGVSKNVSFVDSFVSKEDLVEYLSASDIYITPYLNPQQITSGTLAYALGAGKAVISTPYLYAEELLAEGRGMLVPFRDSDSIADSIVKLQDEEPFRKEMGRNAAQFCQPMRWSEVGKRYHYALKQAISDSSARLPRVIKSQHIDLNGITLPNLTTAHLVNLCDDTGLLQHAIHTVPNRTHGYCVDDNARALLFTTYLEGDDALPSHISKLQACFLSFVHDSFNQENGRFRNFMTYNRQWLEDQGSEDSHARTLWSLASVARRSSSIGHRSFANELFQRGITAIDGMTSPRAWAYAVLASNEYLRKYPADVKTQSLYEKMANMLLREYQICRRDEWRWFEEVASYANARLCQALILAGQNLENAEMLEAGEESLTWLMEHQSDSGGYFSPIGSNGFSIRGQDRATHDQQPLEAWVSVSACISAAKATGNCKWIAEAERAFAWFVGSNSLHQSLYDPTTGGCRDGLHKDRMNENQGAESTLSFLCSLVELKSALAPLSATKNSVRLT